MLLVYYKVRPGDSLQSVAAEHKTTSKILAQTNGLAPDSGVLSPGLLLRIPTGQVVPAERDCPLIRPDSPDRRPSVGDEPLVDGKSLQPVVRAPGERGITYLTFEVSFGVLQIPALLELLAAKGARGTWFVTGIWADRHPALLKQVARAGHQVESHGYDHESLRGRHASHVSKDIAGAAQLIERSLGRRPSLLRPAYGQWDQGLIRAAQAQRHRVVLWSVDSLDWHSFGVQASIDHILNHPLDGAIISMHAGADSVPAILKRLLVELQNRQLCLQTLEAVSGISSASEVLARPACAQLIIERTP